MAHKRLRIHYNVDEMMFPILCTLHNKGYKTKFSCSGHTGQPITHIAFAEDYDFTPPEGFKLIRRGVGRQQFIEAIPPKKRKIPDNFVEANLAVLSEWANSLPVVEEQVEVGVAQNYPLFAPRMAANTLQRMIEDEIYPLQFTLSKGRLRGIVKGRYNSEYFIDITEYEDCPCSRFDIPIRDSDITESM